MAKVSFPIDFVVTWVDQSDKEWQMKNAEYTQKKFKDEDFRYRDYGTLKYLFRSFEKYASWVNHIYLVTDNQVPEWLNRDFDKVTVVDHKEIIPKEYLPTFNSNVIEFHFKNIPGLAEHFVYFNDDMYLNGPTEPTDFFTSDGKYIKDNFGLNAIMATPGANNRFDHIYLNNFQLINEKFNKKQVIKNNFWKMIDPRNGYWTIISLCMLPFPRLSRLVDPHVAIAYKKSTLERVLNEYPVIESMFKNHIRENTDYSIWLARYYELLEGKFKTRSISFWHKYNLDEIDEVVKDIASERHQLLCVNDVAATQDQFEKMISKLLRAFQNKFPEKCMYEK